jgi:UDP-N-acetylmuramoylalanine--D-glutamate ligase
MIDLAGKRLLIVGMARSGVAAAELAVRAGADVTCTDLRVDAPEVPGARASYGRHDRADFLGADLIVVSPGVPARQADLAAAAAAGVEITGELAFAAAQFEAPILAISGTNGKSTTTHLLGQLCVRAGLRTFVGGNLGQPLSLGVGSGAEIGVVEVSSYQMELPGGGPRVPGFRPRAAAILNLTPDHLERHGSMESYASHKCRMFARMGPECAAILPWGEARLTRLASGLPGRRMWLGGRPGVTLHADHLELEGVHDPGRVSLDGFTLPGTHNRENVACAVLLAVSGGLWREQLQLAGLEGLPHRMEVVGQPRGVTWINDSKATNVDASLAAVVGMAAGTWVLLGGLGKDGASYEPLVDPLRRARGVVCFGASGPEIASVLVSAGLAPLRVASLDDGVDLLGRTAVPGESVLMSPACASFDAFTDFEHRGRHFRALVQRLDS